MSAGKRRLVVVRPGGLLTVQDLGRPGLASLGVPESGALDPPALRLANRLVGNPEHLPALEATLGGVELRAKGNLVVAATGAPAPIEVDGRVRGTGEPVYVRDGATISIDAPAAGVRTYLAVRGGVRGTHLLGSASTDLLSGLGDPLQEGDTLELGHEPELPVPRLEVAAAPTPVGGTVRLRAIAGPRADWFTDEALEVLTRTAWTVDARSNRVGLRLTGGELERRRCDELPSEGTVAGSLQVPANGSPVLFLADHPVTGGYPVIAVVRTIDLPLAAQAAPGQEVRIQL